MRKHIHLPSTHETVCTDAHNGMRRGRANDGERINRVGMAAGGLRALENRLMLDARIPQQNLTAISAANNQIRMEWRE